MNAAKLSLCVAAILLLSVGSAMAIPGYWQTVTDTDAYDVWLSDATPVAGGWSYQWLINFHSYQGQGSMRAFAVYDQNAPTIGYLSGYHMAQVSVSTARPTSAADWVALGWSASSTGPNDYVLVLETSDQGATTAVQQEYWARFTEAFDTQLTSASSTALDTGIHIIQTGEDAEDSIWVNNGGYASPPEDDSPELATWLLLACTGAFGAIAQRRRKT